MGVAMTTDERKGLSVKYYVDAAGNYLGGFAGYVVDGVMVPAVVPDGAIEVPCPPPHGWQRWNRGGWEPLPPHLADLVHFKEKA